MAKNPQLLKLAAESGCRILSLGVESISQEGLDKLNKKWVKVQEHEELLRRIVDAGILPATEMIVGTDGDTMDSLKQTYDFVMKTNIPIPKFYIMTPMPGSDLYSESVSYTHLDVYKRQRSASAGADFRKTNLFATVRTKKILMRKQKLLTCHQRKYNLKRIFW